MTVQEGGQLRDGRIGLGHPGAFDQEAVGQHLDLVGACVGQLAVACSSRDSDTPIAGWPPG